MQTRLLPCTKEPGLIWKMLHPKKNPFICCHPLMYFYLSQSCIHPNHPETQNTHHPLWISRNIIHSEIAVIKMGFLTHTENEKMMNKEVFELLSQGADLPRVHCQKHTKMRGQSGQKMMACHLGCHQAASHPVMMTVQQRLGHCPDLDHTTHLWKCGPQFWQSPGMQTRSPHPPHPLISHT